MFAHVLEFVDEVENSLVVAIEVPSDLSGRLRSHLLADVEHLFEAEAMLAEDRVCEVVELRLALLAPVLLSVFASRSSLDNGLTLAMDTRHRPAEPGETVETSFARRKEDPN